MTEQGSPRSWNIDAVKHDLEARPCHAWEWLAESWSEPAPFLQAVLVHHARRHRLPLRSRVGEFVAVFADTLSRHAERGAVAVTRTDGSALRYVELVQLVDARSRYFSRRGLAAGMLIAFVVRDPVALMSGVLAAWKLGAVVSFIEPRGPTYVRTRLEALAPDLIAADHPDSAWLSPWPAEQRLAASGHIDNGHSEVAHDYGPKEELARLFSPFCKEPLKPLPLTAGAWLEGAIREGLMHDLAPGRTVSTPALDVQRHEPCLWSAILLAGATRLVPKDPGERTPALYNADVVGLSGQDLAAYAGGTLPLETKRWFLPLAEPLDVLAIQERAASLHKASMRGCITLGAAATGGSFAWAPAPHTPGALEMAPAPGFAHALMQVGAPGLLAPGPGVLTSDAVDPEALGEFVFGANAGRMYCAGALRWSRGGHTFATAEIEKVAAATPGVEAAVAVIGPGALPNDGRLALLVFVDPRGDWPEGHEAIVESIGSNLRGQLGAATPGPDVIEVYPLVPPGELTQPDRERCSFEYLTGILHRRRRDPLFREVARLRRTLIAWRDMEEATP